MSEKILVPVLGESLNEATVSKWLKSKGDIVNADEAVVELETDKVNLEVPASVSGVLSEINSNEGDTVQVGTVLGVISDSTTKIEKNEKIKPKNIEAQEEKKISSTDRIVTDQPDNNKDKNIQSEPTMLNEEEKPLILSEEEEPLILSEEVEIDEKKIDAPAKEVNLSEKRINGSMGRYYYLTGNMNLSRKYLMKSSINIKTILYLITTFVGSKIVKRYFNIFG